MIPDEDARFDNIGHLIVRTDKKLTSKLCKDRIDQTKRVIFMCKQCTVGFHVDCFADYHVR